MQADLTFRIADNETDAKSSDNAVALMNMTTFQEYNDPNNPTGVQGKTYQIKGESFDRIVIATQGGDPNTGGHEFGHSLGRGGHLEDTAPPGTEVPGIMAGAYPSKTYMTSQDFDHLFSGPLRDHFAGQIDPSMGSGPVPLVYPDSTSKTYRATAIYNRNVVP